jgi:hypothetical protein
MCDIGRHPPQAIDKSLDAVEHCVYALAKSVEFVVGPPQRHATGKIAAGDCTRGDTDRFDPMEDNPPKEDRSCQR